MMKVNSVYCCDDMRSRKMIFARLYGNFRRNFKKRSIRVAIGFAIFFILLIANCVLYFSQAVKPEEQLVVAIDAGHGSGNLRKLINQNNKSINQNNKSILIVINP